MPNYKEHLEELPVKIKSEIERTGRFTLSTCDYPNWDIDQHYAMCTLQRRGIPGLHISHRVTHGVTDCVIVEI